MTTREILDALPRLAVLVVGDVCLDRWCTYDPSLAQPSRETGIPRIAVTESHVTAGAAGTVANNVAALGAGSVAILGAIGDDGFGYELIRALSKRAISAELLIRHPNVTTFTYTKLLNCETSEEDKPRIDFIWPRHTVSDVEDDMLAGLRSFFTQFDVILVSDQVEVEPGGVVTPRVRDLLTMLSAEYPEKVVWVDSRIHSEEYRGLILKPNQEEAEAASMRMFGAPREFAKLREHAQAPLLLVTHGGDGVLMVDTNGESWIPTKKNTAPVDICGAGDSFSAGAALALAVTKDPRAAIEFGHLVASITITKRGTGTASPEEVLALC